MNRILFLIFCIIFLAYSPSPALADIQWSLSVVDGYYKPSLNELNYVLIHPEVELGPRNTEAKPSSYPVIYQGVSPAMPEMGIAAPRIGLQVQADVNPRYAIIFGGSTATFDSVSRDERNFFVGFNIPSARETRFSLSLNQFWLGGKRYWIFENKSDDAEKKSVKVKSGDDGSKLKKPDPRIYAGMGILAITRAYLTTDVWLHVYAPEEGFDFYKVTETGISGSGYATYIGVGGEYYLRKGISIGMDIDYVIGGIGKLKFVRYFTVDPLEQDIIRSGDVVTYTDFRRGTMKPLFIDLEGWDLKGQARFYF
ncbi:MAG: hypothetical protein IT393_02330 [Nitrospirae bacterium]|nr:hypothetical protein [Nitrospirota bacterium]